MTAAKPILDPKAILVRGTVKRRYEMPRGASAYDWEFELCDASWWGSLTGLMRGRP